MALRTAGDVWRAQSLASAEARSRHRFSPEPRCRPEQNDARFGDGKYPVRCVSHIHIYIDTYIDICICIYVYMYICIYVYICICI